MPVVVNTSMLTLPGRRLLRLVLLTLPFVLVLAWTTPGEAGSPGLPQATGGSTTVTETGVEYDRAVAGFPGQAADMSVSISPDSDTESTAAVNDGREDLTVFFSIGVIVDILLVTFFLIWAVGQWRKTGQQERSTDV
jgi:hypothetical protein